MCETVTRLGCRYYSGPYAWSVKQGGSRKLHSFPFPFPFPFPPLLSPFLLHFPIPFPPLFLSPPLPFSIPFTPLLPFPLSSPSFLPPNPARGSGAALPQRGLGGTPAENKLFVHIRRRIYSIWRGQLSIKFMTNCDQKTPNLGHIRHSYNIRVWVSVDNGSKCLATVVLQYYSNSAILFF